MIYLILSSETMEPLHDCSGQKLRAYFVHEYMSSKIDNPSTLPHPIFVRARISLQWLVSIGWVKPINASLVYSVYYWNPYKIPCVPTYFPTVNPLFPYFPIRLSARAKKELKKKKKRTEIDENRVAHRFIEDRETKKRVFNVRPSIIRPSHVRWWFLGLFCSRLSPLKGEREREREGEGGTRDACL